MKRYVWGKKVAPDGNRGHDPKGSPRWQSGACPLFSQGATSGANQRAIVLTAASLGLLLLFLACAGCGPWIDPDDPASVDLACGDVRAVMVTVADVALVQEEADAACATRIAEVFEAFATAVRENSAEAAGEAVDKILKAVAKEQDYRLYKRLLLRATERVSERLEYMGEAPEDDQAAAVAKRLTLAALDGVAEGARDYAAGLSPPSGHGTPAVPG